MSVRRCNECTLCCKLLPVRELRKSANQTCTYQRRSKGCTIHRQAGFPRSCSLWSCGWLIDHDGSTLSRPDRAHYVIDPSPEFIELDDGGDVRIRIDVVQIWVDPKYPLAHRDPALRAWLERRAISHRQAALVRFNSQDAIVLFPPALSADGQWHERTGQGTAEHSTAEILRTLEVLHD